MALPDASVSRMKGRPKLGRVRIGAMVMAVFKESNAVRDLEVQWKAFLHSSLVSGAAMPAYPLTNLR